MPLDFEDRTDISGNPPPIQAHSPKASRSDMDQKVNQNKRGPQPQQQQGGLGGFLGGLKGAAQGVGRDIEGAGDWLKSKGFDVESHPNPVDWPGEVKQDAGAVWGLATDLYSHYRALTDPGFISSSLQQHWNIDDARVRNDGLFQRAAEDALPMALKATMRTLVENPTQPGFLPAAVQRARGESEQQAVGEVGGQELSALADPLTYAAPESKAAQVAAFVGVPALEGLLGQDPNEAHMNLAWAALSGMFLGKGHLPGPVREFLHSRFGNWGEVEKQAEDAINARQFSAEAVADPHKETRLLEDHIQHNLEKAEKMAEGEPIPFDQRPTMPGETLRDPNVHVPLIEDQKAARQHLLALNAIGHVLDTGLWAGHQDPFEQILRAWAGHNRTYDAVFDNYFDSLNKVLGDVSPARRKLMGQASEGSQEAYDQLEAKEKLGVDSWGHLRSFLRQASMGTGQADNFVANYMPRLDEVVKGFGRGRPSRSALLAHEVRKHRAVEEFFDPQTGQREFQQKFKTVQETNQALQLTRQQQTQHLLDTSQQLGEEFQNDPEAVTIRRLARAGDTAQAQERATRLINERYPLKSEDFLYNISGAARYQAKAILAEKAINELRKTLIEAKHPQGGPPVARVAMIKAAPGRQTEEMLRQGYEHINDSRFRGVLVDKDVNDLLKRYQQIDFKLPAAGEAAAKINRQLLHFIMYSPHIHGANIARRMGAAGIQSPVSTLNYLREGKALLPAQQDEQSVARRLEAWQAGVMPPRRERGWQAAFTDQIDAALGHQSDDFQGNVGSRVGQMLKEAPGLGGIIHGYQSYESGFWHWVGDFGVTMFHVEKENAARRGMSDADATAWAARRANSWMGMVLPEDTNPFTAKLSKLAIFAPNWWRTMGELMVPVYKRSGVFHSDQAVKHAVKAALKTTAAMYAFSHVGGNLLNYGLSGHLQAQNQEGSQDRIEITNPWVLHRLQDMNLLPQGVDPNTGVNSQTGARMTMQSPFGGQIHDVEQALGFQSGQPGTRVGPGLRSGPLDLQLSLPGQGMDVEDGMMKFAAARLSPFLNTAAAMGNVDLYAFLTQGFQPRSIVPGQPPAQVTPLSLAYAAMYALPGTSQLAQQVQRNIQRNGRDSMSLFGTQVPNSVGGWLQEIKAAGARTAMSALLGVNPPYATAQKTRGTPLSDADYQKVRDLTSQYDQRQSALSAEALSGQKTPYQWRQAYGDLSRAHQAQMSALFRNAPEYVNGGDGLAFKWDQLYDQATGPDGVVDHTKLVHLQAKFKSEHTPEQMRDLNSVLSKNKAKYPMLAFYHATLDSYDRFQEQWARQRGVDVMQLRADIDGYNALRGDSQAQRKFAAQHSELNQYKRAVKGQFDRTPAGLAYSLFHNDSAKLMRQLKAKHLTVEDLESEVEQQAA